MNGDEINSLEINADNTGGDSNENLLKSLAPNDPTAKRRVASALLRALIAPRKQGIK
ncbi:MAG: hypothetical protein ACKOW9_06135 [Candidatus Paceibacterota bacterium]